VAIEGPLKELGLEDVFQLLELTRKTGVLRIRSERWNDDAVIHFDRGAVVLAARRRSMRRLGQQLLRAGQVTASCSTPWRSSASCARAGESARS
jgi:hypothetical protein